jgi:hypothetical protein
MTACLQFIPDEPLACEVSELPTAEILSVVEVQLPSSGSLPVEFIVDELPSSFWQGLADCDKGEVVDLDVALNTPPPDDE